MVGSGTLFVKMLASKLAYIHATCNHPPPPTFSCRRTVLNVPLTGTPTYTRREWLGQPCRTPDHGLPPLRRQWGLWDPERHRTSKPGGRGAGLAFGPTYGSDPNHHHFPLHATAYCAARTTSNFTGVRRMGSVARVLVGHTHVVTSGVWVVSGVGLVLYVGATCEMIPCV